MEVVNSLTFTDQHDQQATGSGVADKPAENLQNSVQCGPAASRTSSQRKNDPAAMCKEKRPRARTRGRQIWTILDLNQ
jgi:hypothetical protein